MRNAPRSTANQLSAVSVAVCMWCLCPTAPAQPSPHALQGSPVAAAKRGGEVAQGVRADRVCTRLFDGRGEKVLVKRPGHQETASDTPGCRADKAVAKPPEAEEQVETVAPRSKMPPITAGAAQVDRALSRDRQPGTPIAARVSAGRLSATLVTGGTAMFLLQSSLWTYLLVLGLPLWQHVDLLPIVDTAAGDDAASDDPASDADDERAVTHVLDPKGHGRSGPGGGA